MRWRTSARSGDEVLKIDFARTNGWSEALSQRRTRVTVHSHCHTCGGRMSPSWPGGTRGTRQTMRGKTNRARPAAFAVGAVPDSPAHGVPESSAGERSSSRAASPGARQRPDAGKQPDTGETGRWAWWEAEEPGLWTDADLWPDTQPRRRPARRPGTRQPPGTEQGPGRDRSPENGSSRNGHRPSAAQWPGNGHRPEIGHEAWAFRPQSTDYLANSETAGASPAAIAPSPGEWSPKGVRVRRNSLLRRRRRAGGGAMVRKAALDEGLRPGEVTASRRGSAERHGTC